MKEKSENMNTSALTDQLIEKEKAHLMTKVNTKKSTLVSEVKKNFRTLRETLK